MPVEDMTPDAVRKIAREEVVAGWEQVSVDVTTAAGRLEHAALVAWMRERKRLRETSSNQVRITIIGGLVTSALSAIVTYLATFGMHKP